MSEIWPGYDYDKWEGEIKNGCATPQFYYFLLLTIVGGISFVLGVCTAVWILSCM